MVLIGDSIFYRMGQLDIFDDFNPINLASPGYNTENMLFRLESSRASLKLLQNIPVIVIMIGTFNVGLRSLNIKYYFSLH